MRELSLHILDLLQNAVEADARTIDLSVLESLQEDVLVIRVRDDGRGMPGALAASVTDPFTTTRATRHVGLGLPLLAQAARRCGGYLEVRSRPGHGTTVEASFRYSHIDRAPLGDMVCTLLAVLLSGRSVDIRYRHKVDEGLYRFDSAEVRRELGEVPLTHPSVREWLTRELWEGESSLRPRPPAGPFGRSGARAGGEETSRCPG